MNKKLISTLLGVVGLLLWFMPLVNVEFMGQEAFQTGQHIGGIAYLLLLTSLSYATLSWLEQHVPRIIASGVGIAICVLFMVQAGSATAWGLAGLAGVNLVSLALAILDQVKKAH
jgi:hypothetical protein